MSKCSSEIVRVLMTQERCNDLVNLTSDRTVKKRVDVLYNKLLFCIYNSRANNEVIGRGNYCCNDSVLSVGRREGTVSDTSGQQNRLTSCSGTGTGFSPNTSLVRCHYHSTNVPYSFIHLSHTVYNFSN
jgi:hypothetical protein